MTAPPLPLKGTAGTEDPMDKPSPPGPSKADVLIDYEKIDAADINAQVQKAAAARAAARAAGAEAPPVQAANAPASPAAVPPPGFKNKLKGMAVRLLRPLTPVMRLLALPLHEEIQAVVKQLDAANRRIDEMVPTLARSTEYIKLLHLLNHNLVVELTKLRVEHDALKSRSRLQEKDLEFLTKRERAVEEKVFPE